MFTNELSSFHDAFKPMTYFNWFVGMGIDRQPDLSDTANFLMQLYTIIFIPMNWTLIYIGLTVLVEATSYWDSANGARVYTMYHALSYTNSCIAVISPIVIWFQRKELRESLRKMPILDETFRDILGARNQYRKPYIRQICQIIAIFLVMSVVCICDMQWIILLKRSLLEIFAIQVNLHYPIVVMLMLDLNFCSLVGHLRKKFQELNEALLRSAQKPVVSYPGKKIFVNSRKVTPGRQMEYMKTGSSINDIHYLLHESRRIHMGLCELSRKINHAFGIQNLVSMGTCFVMVTGLSYTIYGSAIRKDLTTETRKEIIPTIMWTIIYGFKIWMVSHSCWRVSSEALKTGEVIYELLESRMDKESEKEIQEFGVQMLQNPVRFNACGFFTLDHTFVQGVIGSITTYLVILIQMSNMTAVSSTSNTAVTYNGTKISTHS